MKNLTRNKKIVLITIFLTLIFATIMIISLQIINRRPIVLTQEQVQHIILTHPHPLERKHGIFKEIENMTRTKTTDVQNGDIYDGSFMYKNLKYTFEINVRSGTFYSLSIVLVDSSSEVSTLLFFNFLHFKRSMTAIPKIPAIATPTSPQ